MVDKKSRFLLFIFFIFQLSASKDGASGANASGYYIGKAIPGVKISTPGLTTENLNFDTAAAAEVANRAILSKLKTGTQSFSIQQEKASNLQTENDKSIPQTQSPLPPENLLKGDEENLNLSLIKANAPGEVVDYLKSHQSAVARFASITAMAGMFDQDSLKELHSGESDKLISGNFTDIFLANPSKAQEMMRNMINDICDTSKGNMELLVAAMKSIKGMNSDGESHSVSYLSKNLSVTSIPVAGKTMDLAHLFGGSKEVTPDEIIKKYEELRDECLEKSKSGVSDPAAKLQIQALYELLSGDFKKYNEEHNKAGTLWSSNKGDNVFIDLKGMESYFADEKRHINDIRKHYQIPEQEKPDERVLIENIVAGIGTANIASSTEEYLSGKNKNTYRDSSEALIKGIAALPNPSIEMVHFLLESVSTNKGASGIANNVAHNEAILKQKVECNGRKYTIASALDIAKSIGVDSPEKSMWIKTILGGIGTYYDEHNYKSSTFTSSDKAFHLVLDPEKVEEFFPRKIEETHENKTVGLNAAKVAIKLDNNKSNLELQR